MKRFLAGLLLFIQFVFAQDITVVYMGIIPGNGREFEKSFNALLREQIIVLPGVVVADYNETELLKNKTGFNNSPHISRSFIESLLLVSTERTLIVWGEISDFTIKPVRRWLVGAEALGSLTLSLTLYSLHFHEYVYIGDIFCQYGIPKPPVFFRSVDQVTTISASDRNTVMEELQKSAALKSVDLIGDVVRSQLTKSGIFTEDIKVKKVPSVSDLFDIPTVEPPDIKKETKREPEEKEPQKANEEKPKK